ncbi:MAG: hypothetical protein HUU26_12835, partial [Gemmatimonadaceae bacterium]|nr:hypothetical protein [Gemmatimonadaceae bacterium]
MSLPRPTETHAWNRFAEMTDDIDWDRLARYFAGESAATERAQIERWAAKDPSNQRVVESARRRWEAARDRTQWDTDAAWTRLAPRL